MRLWIVLIVVGVAGLAALLLAGEDGAPFGIESDSFARALYLGLFGLVVGAGILRSGIPFGNVTRMIAAWLAILLVLVGGYQYRYEFQDVASRLTAGLIPGSPMSVTDADGRNTVVLDKGVSGHFEANGSVNGQRVRFLIDTGATTTVLTEADARRAGYDIGELTFNVPVATANGMTRAARATADEIRIGEVFRNRQPVFVAGPGQLGQSLLGMSFLSSLAGYNVRGDRMVLID